MSFTTVSRRWFSCTTRALNKKDSSKFAAAFMERSGSSSNPFLSQMSGPPKLPEEEQKEFERLQKIANSQAAIDEYNETTAKSPTNSDPEFLDKEAKLDSPNIKNDIGGFSPEYFKTIPEFEGDKNPKTGEIGGPKQEPLKHGDWSFNGRVTDF